MHISVFSMKITVDNVDQPELLEAIIKSIEEVLLKMTSVASCWDKYRLNHSVCD